MTPAIFLRLAVRALGRAIFFLLLINLIYFIVAYLRMDAGASDWSLGWQNGAFSINGEQVGMSAFSARGIRFLVLLFCLGLYFQYTSWRRAQEKTV